MSTWCSQLRSVISISFLYSRFLKSLETNNQSPKNCINRQKMVNLWRNAKFRFLGIHNILQLCNTCSPVEFTQPASHYLERVLGQKALEVFVASRKSQLSKLVFSVLVFVIAPDVQANFLRIQGIYPWSHQITTKSTLCYNSLISFSYIYANCGIYNFYLFNALNIVLTSMTHLIHSTTVCIIHVNFYLSFNSKNSSNPLSSFQGIGHI